MTFLGKTATVLLATGSFAGVFAFTVPAVAQQPPAPPLVKQLNNGNWLPQQEAEAPRDEQFYLPR